MHLMYRMQSAGHHLICHQCLRYLGQSAPELGSPDLWRIDQLDTQQYRHALINTSQERRKDHQIGTRASAEVRSSIARCILAALTLFADLGMATLTLPKSTTFCSDKMFA